MNLLTDLESPLWESKGIIYVYTNLINGKKYIGLTTRKMKNRHREHLNVSKNKIESYDTNVVFHNAIRKYGIENFTLEILHSDLNLVDLNSLEKYYINFYDSLACKNGYNVSSGGSNGNPYAGKTKEEIEEIKRKMIESHKNIPTWWDNATDEEKERRNKKLSESLKGRERTEEHCKHLSDALKSSNKNKDENHPMYGKHHTEKSKTKISESRKGKNCGEDNYLYGKQLAEETKQKISNTLKGRNCGKDNPNFGCKSKQAKKVAQYDKNGKLIKVFNCCMDVVRELNVSQSAVSCCCNFYRLNENKEEWYKHYKGKPRKTVGGFIFKFVDEE